MMKRRALFLFVLAIALSGLTLSPIRSNAADAADDDAEADHGTTLSLDTCLASPFGRSIDGPTRDSVSVLLAQPNGGPLLSDVENAASGSLGTDGPDVYDVGGSPSYGTQVAAQLTGDGYESLVSVAGRSGYQPSLVVQRQRESGGATRAQLTLPDPAVGAALAAGRFRGQSSVADWKANGYVTEPDQVVVATRGYAGNLNAITLRLYTPTGDGDSLQASAAVRQWFTSPDTYEEPEWEDLQVAALDIDGDRQDEIAVLYRDRISLKIDLLRLNSAGNGFTKVGSTYDLPFGNKYTPVRHVRLVSGFFGDAFHPELAVAYVQNQTESDGRQPAYLKTIGVDRTGAMTQTGSRTFRVTPANGRYANFALTGGDTAATPPAEGEYLEDSAAPDELVFAHVDNGVKVDTIDASTSALATHNSFTESADYVSGGAYAPYGLAVGAGDLDLNGTADIVLTYLNGGISHLVWLKDRTAQGQGLIRKSGRKGYYWLDGLTDLRPLSVTMFDKRDQTVRLTMQAAVNNAPCRDFRYDDRLMTASDATPFWRNLMDYGKDYGSTNIAMGSSHESGDEYGFIRHFGLETSLSLGVGFSAETPILGSLFGSVEEKLIRSIGYQFDYNWGHSDESSSSTWTSSGWWNDGAGTEVQTYRTPYRCYYYTDSSGGLKDTSCEPIDPDAETGAPEQAVAEWDEEKWEKDSLTDPTDSWAPVRAPWTNRALLLPAANATQSSGTSAALAIDGDTDARHAETTAQTAPQIDPYWQVKLAKSEKLGLVRIWQGGNVTCTVLSDCPQLLQDVNVYVFDDPALANAPSTQLQARIGEGVYMKHLPGTVGDILNVVTRDAQTHLPVQGRYVRVERATGSTPAALSLAEVEVYAADTYQAPPEYPRDVRAVTPNTMQVLLWNPSTADYVWKTVRGALVDLPSTNQLPWYQINQGCGPYAAWDYSKSSSTTHRSIETFAHDWTAGGEFEFEAKGAGADAVLQIKEDNSLGFEKQYASSRTVGSDFALSGWRSDYCASEDEFPDYKEADTSAACEYRFRPFYYLENEVSDYGRSTSLIHVSYIVDMDRSKDLRNCVDGHWRSFDNQKPTLPDLTAATAAGQATTIDIRSHASDPNPEDTQDYLHVYGVASVSNQDWSQQATTDGGSVSVVDNQLVYTPSAGFTGPDTFFVVLTDGDKLSTPAKVTVMVADTLQDGGCDTPSAWGTVGSAAVADGACKVAIDGNGVGGSLSQTFYVPTDGNQQLTFSHIRLGQSDAYGDAVTTRIAPFDGTPVPLTPWTDKAGIEESTTYDLSAYRGQVVTLTFEAAKGTQSLPMEWDIDNLSVS
jgi:hypothetical protein